MADNQKMIKNLFASMQDALFLGDRFLNGEFVSFLQPGQFISNELQENGDSDDMAIQAEIANIIVDSSYVNKYKDTQYSTGTELVGSVNQVYSDILEHGALPYKELSNSIRKEIESIEQWLANNGNNYTLYEGRYLDAVEAYEVEKMSQSPRPGRLRVLDQAKRSAFRNWEIHGKKSTYESKYSRLIYLTGENPTSLWAKLRERVRNHQQLSPKFGEYLQTFLIPSISTWNNSSWATFEQEIAESDVYEYSKMTSWSAGVSGKWGLWSWGGGASGSSTYKHNKSSVSSVKLKFDYLRVRIYRPWMVSDVFGYRFWTWKMEFGGTMISDGGNFNANPPIRPIGRMPVLPQYLIIVKNVELAAAFSNEEKEFYRREVQSNASIGWGPFSVSGSYKSTTEMNHVKASFDGITFRINHPQIIARSGILLGKSPNPRTNLPWQGDQWFPGDDTDQMLELEQIRLADYNRLLINERLENLQEQAEKVKEEWLTDELNRIDEK